MAPEIISKEFSRQIHQRLLAKDPVAPSELAEAMLIPLSRRLRGFFRAVDEELIYDAAVDAILTYVQHPESYNQEKSGLFTFLTISARGDLLNLLKKEGKRKKHEFFSESVELTEASRNRRESLQSSDEMGPLEILEHREALKLISNLIEGPRDRDLLELMLAGERKTSAFARTLGLENLDAAEQRKIVKQHKDRLKKRLERAGVKFGEKD
jgi:RNA polymerase sigma-70 factor, ECF subfamily